MVTWLYNLRPTVLIICFSIQIASLFKYKHFASKLSGIFKLLFPYFKNSILLLSAASCARIAFIASLLLLNIVLSPCYVICMYLFTSPHANIKHECASWDIEESANTAESQLRTLHIRGKSSVIMNKVCRAGEILLW